MNYMGLAGGPESLFAGFVEAGMGFQDKRNRNPNWTDHEIVRFLEMLQEDDTVRDLVANRNKKVSYIQKLSNFFIMQFFGILFVRILNTLLFPSFFLVHIFATFGRFWEACFCATAAMCRQLTQEIYVSNIFY